MCKNCLLRYTYLTLPFLETEGDAVGVACCDSLDPRLLEAGLPLLVGVFMPTAGGVDRVDPRDGDRHDLLSPSTSF